MSNIIYDTLALFGYTHPIHPVLVHVPVGMSIGAVCFSLLAYVTKEANYRSTAYQAIVLALIFTLLAIPVGIIDWQRFYGGAWLFEIKIKSGLAALYFILVASTVVAGRRRHDRPVLPVLYGASMLTVMGLGFFGGQLIYRGFAPEAPEHFKVGRDTFESHCSGCHRRGENIIEPNMPLRNARQLHDFNEFLAYIRDPRMPNGLPGIMPKFPTDKLSDQDAKQLYDYLYFAFLTPNRPPQ